MARTIEIEDNVTVGTLAERIMMPVTQLIGELMKNGIIATVNERIDFDTAQIIVGELGLNDIELVKKAKEDQAISIKNMKKTTNSKSGKLINRPPVVAVMGHVDHGKTSLLDAIRGSEVVKGEAGGITQHISAYQIVHNNRQITLLDTPGHEAFAAIRSHGAALTDLTLIVIAADDGVKPQTLEALRFANQAGSKIIIVINKIDKEGADSNRLKQQLAENGIMVEGWGGDVVCVEVSAKTKKGIDELLDMIFLIADVEDLKAPIDVPGEGIIIESHMEKGRGPVAHALVNEGIVKSGDFIVAGSTYSKIRNLETPDGEKIEKAGPATPVVITGFKNLPEFADTFVVVTDEKIARNQSSQHRQSLEVATNLNGINSGELIRIINRTNLQQELPILVKADTQGSLTSVIDGLRSLETDEVTIRVVSSGVGALSEGDIHVAKTAKAVVYGFNVTAAPNIIKLANRDKIIIKFYKVIYELLDDAKDHLGDLLAPEIVETSLGTLKVKGVFKTSKTEIICGGEVTSGKLTSPALARISRKGEVLAVAEVMNIKRGPQDAKEVVEGEMCGLNLKTISKLEILEGDEIELFITETKVRKL
jgi:translation initiation factor IF-2